MIRSADGADDTDECKCYGKGADATRHLASAFLPHHPMGTFEPYADKAGPFRFRPMARNGETILKSEGYTTADAGNRAAKDTQDMSKP